MTDSTSAPDWTEGADPAAGPPVAPGATDASGATAAPAAPATRRGKTKAKKPASLWRELPVLLVVAIALAFVFKTLFVAVFFIPSASMEHTLIGSDNGANTGDRVVVNKLVYDFRDPHRGEIVVFNGKNTPFNADVNGDGTQAPANRVSRDVRKGLSVIGLGSDPNEKDFIKRVIAIGGDTISCPALPNDASDCAHIVVNGHPVDESSYLFNDQNHSGSQQQDAFTTCTVPTGKLFVMGDHRDDSADSRPNGPIPVGNVIGRAFAKVYPFGRAGGLGVPKVWQTDFTPTADAGEGAPPCAPMNLRSGG